MSNEVPERIFLRACHPANPNHNCTWSVSKESTQSVEYIRADLAAARVECGLCDSTDLKFCADCFDKPASRAKARTKECERLMNEREHARARIEQLEQALQQVKRLRDECFASYEHYAISGAPTASAAYKLEAYDEIIAALEQKEVKESQ